MSISYPEFVRTKEDKAAYRVAVEGGWAEWVRGPNDILAIKEGCYFDIAAAQRVERFFLDLPHIDGEWVGEPLTLQPWQRDEIIYPLFGWKRSTGFRRYFTAFIFLPKKNGKSTLCAAISLYLLLGDGEPGAQVYNASSDIANTDNVFGAAAAMLQRSPFFKKWVEQRKLEVFKGIHRINYPKTNSFYKALPANATTVEGIKWSGLIFDELHTQGNRKLWKALQGGGASRRQPLNIAITTAGDGGTESLCYKEYQRAKETLSGVRPNWSHFAYIVEAAPTDDPGDPKTWAKANPGYGVSPKPEFLASQWEEKKGSPDGENEFKQYHLNLWVQRAESAIPLDLWDKGGQPFDPNSLIGKTCYAGLDIGAVSDLTALTLVFPQEDESVKAICYFWCPEDRSKDRGQKKISYLQWIKDGWLTPTKGNVTDYKQVRREINQIAAKYDIRTLAVDTQIQGMQLASELLNEDGLPVVAYSNSILSMGPPTRTFMELVMSGNFHHGSNPVLRWMAANLVFKRKDAQNNLMPDKSRSHEKIDGISAAVMALGVMAAPQQQVDPNEVYERRGVLMV